MPDDILANQTSAAGGTGKPPPSPWAEELDANETPDRKQPSIIGSLDGALIAPAQREVAPLALPHNIEEKVGQKLPAENFVAATEEADRGGDAALPHPPRELELAGQSESGFNLNEGKVVSFATDIKKPSIPPLVRSAAPPQISAASVPSPSAIPPANTPPPVASVSQPSTETLPKVAPIAQPPPSTAPEKRAGLIGTLRNRIRPPATPASNPPATNIDDYVRAQINKELPLAPAKTSLIQTKRSFWHSTPILMTGGFVCLVAIVIFLTELGFFSLGLEKVYGAIGLERIWGGLPKNATSAIFLSAGEMSAEPNFKVKGEINLSIDKSKNSPVTSPLIAIDHPGGNILAGVAAVLAASYDYSDALESDFSEDDYYLDDEDSEEESNAEEEEAEPDTDSSTSSQDQYPSYQALGAAVKEVNSTLAVNFGQGGSEAAIKVRRVTGDDEIQLRVLSDKLWVKSSDRLIFNKEALSTNWSEYTLASLQNKLLQRDFFSLNADNGFSATGRRVANERIGDERAYRYSLESLEIGNSLDDLGLDSEMIQSASGNIWIGIRDKRLKRVNLMITTSPAAAVTKIVANLDFYDYGAVNSIMKPEASAIVAPGVGAAAGETTVPVVPTGDAKRKSDLAEIKKALTEYKQANGSYPAAATLIKLNAAGNALEAKLAPKYLAGLPKDGKDAEGWFYGYKSDGRTYSLSARLENTSDPEGQSAGGVYLYYLNSE